MIFLVLISVLGLGTEGLEVLYYQAGPPVAGISPLAKAEEIMRVSGAIVGSNILRRII